MPPGVFIGVSLILPVSGRYLFGIRPPKRHENQAILELTGIGGGVEPSDQSLSHAALRETTEEICCQVQLNSSDSTLIVYDQGRVEAVEIVGVERPAAIVYRNYRTPPHQPWHPNHSGWTCLAVFWGTLIGQPKPCGELPWLLCITERQILETARRDIPLAQLLENEAVLITGKALPPQMNALVRLTDSQEALALALGEGLIRFYKSANYLDGLANYGGV